MNKTEFMNMVKAAQNEVKITVDNEYKILHPDYQYSFNSILGRCWTLGNGIRFINNDEFKLNWLGRRLSKQEFNAVKYSDKTYIPRYWDIANILLVDRILSDKKAMKLLIDITTNDAKNKLITKFVVYFNYIRGVFTKEIPVEKLTVYSLQLTVLANNLRMIAKELEIDDVETVNLEKLTSLKHKIRMKTFEEMLEKEGCILEGLAPLNNNELGERWVK